MLELIRDSAFGHCVRLVTRGKYLQYPEERDPEIWKKYVSHEKSGYAAYHDIHIHLRTTPKRHWMNSLTRMVYGVANKDTIRMLPM